MVSGQKYSKVLPNEADIVQDFVAKSSRKSAAKLYDRYIILCVSFADLLISIASQLHSLFIVNCASDFSLYKFKFSGMKLNVLTLELKFSNFEALSLSWPFSIHQHNNNHLWWLRNLNIISKWYFPNVKHKSNLSVIGRLIRRRLPQLEKQINLMLSFVGNTLNEFKPFRYATFFYLIINDFVPLTFFQSEPIRVVVTGAAGQIAYSLLYIIANGEVFGKDQKLVLTLLDIAPMMGVLEGVVMELADCAFPLLTEVIPTADPAVAFKDVSAAFLVGAMPRREGMERKDLLSANVKIFKVQGEALNNHAKKDVKVLVVGNPANTNALICSHYAPSIPRENFTAMTRLDQNRARAQIAQRLKTDISNVKNLIIWGNHSGKPPNLIWRRDKSTKRIVLLAATQFPDVANGTANGKPVTDLVDAAFLQNEFIGIVQKRGAAVIAARKMSSAMSAAKAASDHVRDWWQGTQPETFVSMGVVSDGSYGIPKDIVFSFPVEIKDRQWKIVSSRKQSNISFDSGEFMRLS